MNSVQEIVCNLDIYVEKIGRSFPFHVMSNNGLYYLRKGNIPRKPNISAFLAYSMGLEARMNGYGFEIGIKEKDGFRRRGYNPLRLEEGYLVLWRNSKGEYIIHDPENRLRNSK